jgi:hypothetical protein
MADRYDKIVAFFNGVPTGELLWYLDYNEAINLPAHISSRLELYEELNCTYIDGAGPSTTERYDATLTVCEHQENDILIKKITTPLGLLEYATQNGHPAAYPVRTCHECEVLQYIYEHILMEPGAWPVNIPLHQIGLVDSSPVQRLLQYEMGMENFYYLATDHASSLESLLVAMHRVQMKRTEAACKRDVGIVYQAENTSTTMISPNFYEKYSLPQLKEQADYVHRHGKKFILHMCGLLNGLLDLIKQTGIDGIHSVTPAPVGDTPFELVYEKFGNAFPIQGRFGSTQWYGLSCDEIRDNLRKIISFDLLRNRPFVLLVTADGIKVEYEELKKLQAVFEDINRTCRV